MQENQKIEFVPPQRILWQQGEITGSEVLFRNSGKFQTLWKKELCCISAGGSILLDYGEELQGSVRLVLGRCSPTGYIGERPYKVRIRLGESVSEAMDEPINHHTMHNLELLLAPMGENRFGRSGFRFVRIDNLEDIALKFYEISALKMLPESPRRGSFLSSDPLLNDIFEASARTVDNCICGLIMDGAKRDRLVWMGDLYAELRALHALYGDHPAIRPTMEFMLDEAKESGIFNGISPYSPYFFTALREYLKYVPAADWAISHKVNICNVADKMLARWENEKELLLTHGIIDWHEESGLAQNGYPALLAWGVLACRDVAEIFGDQDLKQRCTDVYNDIRNSFVLADTNGSKSVAAAAVAGGLADPQKVWQEILSQQAETGLSTLHMDNILKAWSRAGKTAPAIELLKKYYGGMLSLGSTTFWEHFELEYLDNAARIDQLPQSGKRDVHKECGRGCFAGLRHSFCHGWGAAVIGWMTEELAGVRSAVDGFAEAEIAGTTSFDGTLECSVPVPCGTIRIRRINGKISELNVPEGLKYTLV